MELIALQTFVAVVDEGGILAASRQLNTVQSNVTSRIHRLEEELGCALFFRKGRGLELAPAGRVLLDYARRIVLLARQTSDAVRQVGISAGELRIGSMETIAALYLPKALRALKATHTQLALRVLTDTSSALTEKVLDHKLDCALVAGPVVHPDMGFDVLIVEELVQIHAVGTDPVLQPLIVFREGCAYRARALAWQRATGHAVADAMAFGTLEGILGCVAAGLGWTLMPRRVVEQSPHIADLAVVVIPESFSRVPVGMIYLKEVPAMAALKTLKEAVIMTAQAL